MMEAAEQLGQEVGVRLASVVGQPGPRGRMAARCLFLLEQFLRSAKPRDTRAACSGEGAIDRAASASTK